MGARIPQNECHEKCRFRHASVTRPSQPKPGSVEAIRLLKERGGLHADVGIYAVTTVQEEIHSFRAFDGGRIRRRYPIPGECVCDSHSYGRRASLFDLSTAFRPALGPTNPLCDGTKAWGSAIRGGMHETLSQGSDARH